jgi:hypothetical protein
MQTCTFIEADDTQCFVSASEAAVVVAFRGTEQVVADWLADLNILSTDRPYGTVHRGFRGAFDVVDSQLRAELAKFSGRPVLLSGHSLGGALATIAAAEWRGDFDVRWVYTYGQPALGRSNFVGFMNRHYASKFIRIVNNDDIVARVPPTYTHVGRLKRFDARGNVTGGTESLFAEVAPNLAATTVAPAPPMMSEAEFDQLRARLLAERAMRRSGVPARTTEAPGAESIFTIISDHSLEGYIAKIAAKADEIPAAGRSGNVTRSDGIAIDSHA